jgi:hypothetical protein
MANKYMKKCSTSLTIKEMQIKTALRFHFAPVKMATFKSTNNNKWWQRCSETGTFIHHWWKCKLVQPLWKAVWRVLKKLKIELPYDPVILILWIYLKKCKSRYIRDTCTPIFISALFTVAKLWK